MAFGRLKVDQIETSTQIVNVDDLAAVGGASDGNKGDITVASGVWTVNSGAVSYDELANLPSFTGPVVAGRESGTGALQGLSLGNGLSISGGTLSVTVSGGGTGSVTSVGLIAPSGFAVAGSPITSSGNITLSFAAGYSLPTTASQTNWDTAYSERLYWDGGATGLNAVTARTSLGLGNSATLNVGTTAGTVAAGDALGVHVAAADPHPNYALESSLAAVATTGAYSDLTGKPSIPSAADALPQNLGVAAIGISTDYAREDHTHAMPSAGDVGADPAGTAASGISAHVAASDPHPGYALESNLAAVATTGSYGDLTGTPVIPSGADATPQPLGVAAVGASTDYAREDHVHAMPSAADVGADPAGTASSAISSHEAAADPHPGYALESSLGGAALLNVGTTTGTVAAGDDSRFVPAGGTTGQALIKSSGTDYDASWQTLTVSDVFVIACSDETSNLTAGTNKARFTMPYAGTLTAVKADVNTAPTGSTLVVDINEAGVSVLSTKLSIDAGETSSSTAATPAVISDSALANGAVIGIDIDQIGSTVAGAGLKVTLYVTRS